jgi:deaminated glutathione amidase
MRIALAQFTAGTDPAKNLKLVLAGIGQAVQERADLVVFPEAMICSFARPRADAAEPLDGPWASAVRAAAAAAEVTVIVGTFTPGRSAKVRNTLLVTGPAIEAHYNKIHLFDAYGYRESDQIEPGDALVVVEIGGVKIGLTTCYDLRFPELFKALALQGADVIVVPSSWAPGERKVAQWRSLAVARALDSTSLIVAVGQALPPAGGAVDGPRKPTGVGHSIVVGPLGDVLLELGEAPELAVLDLDPSVVAAARETLPVLTNARFTSALTSADPAQRR